MLKLIVLFTVFLAVWAAYDMPPEEADAKQAYATAKLVGEVIDDQPVLFHPARHSPGHTTRFCHDKYTEKLDQLCPNKCHVVDSLLKHDMCNEGIPDWHILLRCCPDQINAEYPVKIEIPAVTESVKDRSFFEGIAEKLKEWFE